MQKSGLLLLLLTIFQAHLALAQFYDGQTVTRADLSQLVERVQPGTIVLLGENHGLASHRDQHMQVLNALRARGLKVSLGLEFVNYTDQPSVDQFREGQIDEATFLQKIAWAGFSFDFYRQQLLFPDIASGAHSLGLNIPRNVTSKISKQGLESLTPEEQALMPPNFALGRDSYKARFMEAAGQHCKNPDNCFAAQCTWDDTMAWQSTGFISQHPDQVLVVVVGEFHVQYGGGIKYRLQQRLPGVNVVTLSQIWAEGLTDDDIAVELQPSSVEGPRADFIWVSRP